MPDQNNAPERIWVRVTDKTVMARKPSDADEYDVEYIRADHAAPTDNTALVEAAYHAGIDAAANRYRVCASPDVWDYFYTAYNAMLDLKTFPMPAALASREAQQPAGEAKPVGCGQPCGYDCNGACFDPHACQQEAVTVALKNLMRAYKDIADSGDAGFWKAEETPEYQDALRALKGES